MKIICLIGKTCSGKTFLLNELVNNSNFHRVITNTSRAKRIGEIDNIDYNFLTDEEFENGIENDEYIEYEIFNNWFYGTSHKSLSDNKVNILVINPSGFKTLLKKYGAEQVKGFYISAPFILRFKRYIKREGSLKFEIVRRLYSDYKDFKSIKKIETLEILHCYDGLDTHRQIIEGCFNYDR